MTRGRMYMGGVVGWSWCGWGCAGGLFCPYFARGGGVYIFHHPSLSGGGVVVFLGHPSPPFPFPPPPPSASVLPFSFLNCPIIHHIIFFLSFSSPPPPLPAFWIFLLFFFGFGGFFLWGDFFIVKCKKIGWFFVFFFCGWGGGGQTAPHFPKKDILPPWCTEKD